MCNKGMSCLVHSGTNNGDDAFLSATSGQGALAEWLATGNSQITQRNNGKYPCRRYEIG